VPESTRPYLSGGCACGAVRFEVAGPLRPVIGCHCVTCRKTSGHFVAATQAAREDVRLVEDRGLGWFASSDVARRGFCRECGSSLFFERRDTPRLSIMAGALDAPTGLALREHYFTAEAGDYYRIDDDLPRHAGYPISG